MFYGTALALVFVVPHTASKHSRCGPRSTSAGWKLALKTMGNDRAVQNGRGKAVALDEAEHAVRELQGECQRLHIRLIDTRVVLRGGLVRLEPLSLTFRIDRGWFQVIFGLNDTGSHAESTFCEHLHGPSMQPDVCRDCWAAL